MFDPEFYPTSEAAWQAMNETTEKRKLRKWTDALGFFPEHAPAEIHDIRIVPMAAIVGDPEPVEVEEREAEYWSVVVNDKVIADLPTREHAVKLWALLETLITKINLPKSITTGGN